MTDKTVAIITGAVGGMGQACARALGRRHRLFLNDLSAARLEECARSLTREGHTVAGFAAGDLAAPDTATSLVGAARKTGPVGVVIHTAGLSPALADWEAILVVNLVGTERLLQALEDDLEPGLAAVLIASMAGHMTPAIAAVDALLGDPLAPDLLRNVCPHLDFTNDCDDKFSVRGQAYGHSKRAVIRMCEARAGTWGAKGARIVSISPGVIRTPMGEAEIANNPPAGRVMEAAPMGRWGSVLDIAAAAEFLASDQASFITGCDLRVDGGVTPFLASASGR